MPSPKAIAEAVASEIGPKDAPLQVSAVIAQLSIKNLWEQSGFHDDFADKVRISVCVELRAILDRHEEGFYTPFELFGLEDQFIAGRYRPIETDDADTAQAKIRRSQISEIIRAINRLSPDEFELLCQKLPELMEGERQAFKPRANDQGIDFFSRVKFGSLITRSVLGLGRERQLNAWIVGQAKHYKKTVVKTSEIRELVGAIDLARAKIFSSNNDPLENLFIKLCEPIFYCFFSSGQFTSGSKKLMEKAGIIYLEGYDIAQFLADSEVGFEDSSFDEAKFHSWMNH